MLRTVQALCASRRNQLLLGAAAVALPLLILFVVLEINYRVELARELAPRFTDSPPTSPSADAAKLPFDTADPQWMTLARRTEPVISPNSGAEADVPSRETTQGARPAATISRDQVPLPRARPN
jgi:hypothetical protein